MNESYPSHRAPQQNPMKHRPLHRVALMHPVSHRRVKGVSMGPKNSSLRLVLVAVFRVMSGFLGLVLPALFPLIIHVIAPLGFLLKPFLTPLYLHIQPRPMSNLHSLKPCSPPITKQQIQAQRHVMKWQMFGFAIIAGHSGFRG